MLALVHALTLTSVAEEYSTKLPKNMSVVVPMSSAAWRDGIARTNKLLGGKVSAVAIFCREADTPAFGPIANTLAKQLGGERAVYIAAVLDATDSTIGDDSISLPHVLLVLPKGERLPWAEWLPNMFTPQDRLQVAKALAEWVVEQVDECADSGECNDAMDESKAAVVRSRVQEDLKKQSGEATKRSSRAALAAPRSLGRACCVAAGPHPGASLCLRMAAKKTLSFKNGRLEESEERMVPALSPPSPPPVAPATAQLPS